MQSAKRLHLMTNSCEGIMCFIVRMQYVMDPNQITSVGISKHSKLSSSNPINSSTE